MGRPEESVLQHNHHSVRTNDWFKRLSHITGALWANQKSRWGIIILMIFILMGIVGPMVMPYSPTANHFPILEGPSAKHWLGTTQAGQDVLSRLLYGSRQTLVVTLSTGVLSTFIAMVFGITSGYLYGWMDETLSLFTNVMLVLPSLPLLIVLAAYVKTGGMITIILIIGITSWPAGARSLRSQVKSIRTRDFVTASRLAGDGIPRILIREILPNMLSLVAANFMGAALTGLMAAVGLEFLGFGDPSAVSWGTMLYWAKNSSALLSNQWAWILSTGLCIAFLGMALVLINFGFDKLANPRLRGKS